MPFKKNEDVNLTKETHSSMTSKDLLLSQQECDALLQQGFIEPIQLGMSSFLCREEIKIQKKEKETCHRL